MYSSIRGDDLNLESMLLNDLPEDTTCEEFRTESSELSLSKSLYSLSSYLKFNVAI